jgi:hypothetical protein
MRQALSRAGLDVIAGFGASRYRIDLVVRHPVDSDRYLLALESDGAGYHSAPTARDRDRLRQEHLERRGWRFLRIWALDWFRRGDDEVARVVDAYRRALAGEDPANAGRAVETSTGEAAFSRVAPAATTAAAASAASRRPPPAIPRGLPIDEYDDRSLERLLRWVKSDGRLRTHDDLLEAMMDELGLERHGRRIDARLREVIEREAG